MNFTKNVHNLNLIEIKFNIFLPLSFFKNILSTFDVKLNFYDIV